MLIRHKFRIRRTNTSILIPRRVARSTRRTTGPLVNRVTTRVRRHRQLLTTPRRFGTLKFRRLTPLFLNREANISLSTTNRYLTRLILSQLERVIQLRPGLIGQVNTTDTRRAMNFYSSNPLTTLDLRNRRHLASRNINTFKFRPHIHYIIRDTTHQGKQYVLNHRLNSSIRRLQITISTTVTFQLTLGGRLHNATGTKHRFSSILTFRLNFHRRTPNRLLTTETRGTLASTNRRPISLRVLRVAV